MSEIEKPKAEKLFVFGRPVEELTREELIQALHVAVKLMQEDRERYKARLDYAWSLI